MITFGVAACTALALAFLPMFHTESCAVTDGSSVVCETSTETLIEHEGATVIGVLLVPAGVALAAVFRPTRRIRFAVAAVLTTLAALGAASIGLLFLPTVLAGWISAIRSPRTPRRRPGTGPPTSA